MAVGESTTQSGLLNLLKFSSKRKLPVILQNEVAECGLASVAMIAGFYNYDTDITTLRGKFSISSHGTTLKQVMDISAKMNFSTRALRIGMEDLHNIQLPCIVHWDLNHFVALKSISKDKILIHDPAIGERKFTFSEFGKHFTGVVLELTPTSSFEQGDTRNTLKISDFWSNITGLKRSLIQIISMSLLLQFFAIIAPFYMQTIIDDVLLRNDTNLLLALALGFSLLLIIQTGTTLLRSYTVLHLSNRLNIQMGANLFRHLIRLPLDYFSKRHMGDIVSRFGSLGSIRSVLTSQAVAAVVDGIMAIITLVVMFVYSPLLSIVVVLFLAVYAVIRYISFYPLRLLTEENIIASAKQESHFMESLRAIQTIKVFQKENDRQAQWQNRFADTLNTGIKVGKLNITFGTINQLLFGLEGIVVVYLAAFAVIDAKLSVGMMMAFMTYKTRFISGMQSLIENFIQFKMLGLHLDRLADIVLTEEENVDEHYSLTGGDSDNQQRIFGKVEVKNLSYSYGDDERPVFENLNFIIEPGETVAITGPSGCGKTTLIKCLMGLIEPTEGEVLIDDKPLKSLPYYRGQIAGVMQDDQLISGSIMDNIACFDPQMDKNKVIICAQLSCIHDEIMSMPMQYHTLVGDMGSALSGGQKQRIILARAIYRQPCILFMDEATSHLDVENEVNVNRHIKDFQTTRILVAHRPGTVESAGRRIQLD